MNAKLKEFLSQRMHYPQRMYVQSIGDGSGYFAVGIDALNIGGVMGVNVPQKRGREPRYEFTTDMLPAVIAAVIDVRHELSVFDTDEEGTERETLHRPEVRLATPPEDNPAEETESDNPDDYVDPEYPHPDDEDGGEEEEVEAGAEQQEETEGEAPPPAAPALAQTPPGFDYQDRLIIPTKLKLLTAGCADETTRYSTTGVRLLRTVKGWEAQATDGRVAVWIGGENKDLSTLALRNTFETILLHQPDTAESVIPADAWEKGLSQGFGKDRSTHAGIALGKNQCAIAVDGSVLRIPPVEGRFPDMGAMVRGFARTPPMMVINLNPKLLEKVCRMFAALGSGLVGAPRITLLVYGKDKPMGIVGETEDGLSLSAAIMPMT